MSHWRTGVCAPALWLNREQCCWGSRDIEFDDVHNELCKHVSQIFVNEHIRSSLIFVVENLVRHIWYECFVC